MKKFSRRLPEKDSRAEAGLKRILEILDRNLARTWLKCLTRHALPDGRAADISNCPAGHPPLGLGLWAQTADKQTTNKPENQQSNEPTDQQTNKATNQHHNEQQEPK